MPYFPGEHLVDWAVTIGVAVFMCWSLRRAARDARGYTQPRLRDHRPRLAHSSAGGGFLVGLWTLVCLAAFALVAIAVVMWAWRTVTGAL